MAEGRVCSGRGCYCLCQSPLQRLDPLGIEIIFWNEETLLFFLGDMVVGPRLAGREMGLATLSVEARLEAISMRGPQRKHLGLIRGLETSFPLS